MTSSFTVHDASGYEQLMGRRSQKLAPPFIDFSGLADGEKILDVGCGTGSLTFALAKAADVSEIAGIDYSPIFVEAANRRNTDPRITIRQADACALPFDADTFDRALALLVLHFVPEAGKAVAEMRRVVRGMPTRQAGPMAQGLLRTSPGPAVATFPDHRATATATR